MDGPQRKPTNLRLCFFFRSSLFAAEPIRERQERDYRGQCHEDDAQCRGFR